MRDDDADPVAQQSFGGPLHPRLGDRVQPSGGLVEDHHVRLPDQDPGERHQLLLTGGEHMPALPQPGRQPVRQLGDPAGQAQLVERPSSRFEQLRVEERHVLGERAGQDLGALRHQRHPAAQLLDVEVAQVGAAKEDSARRHVDRPGEHLRERRLARTGPPDQRVRATAREGEAEPAQRGTSVTLPVPECQIPNAQVTLARAGPADRLLPGLVEQLHPRPRAERLLDLRHHPADVFRCRPEGQGEQPDGGEPRGVDPAGGQRPGTAEHHSADARPDRRGGHRRHPGGQHPDHQATGQHGGGPPGVQPQHVRPRQTGANVVLAVHRLLHHGGQVGPRLLLGHPGRADPRRGPAQADREHHSEQHHRDPGRPPHEKRHDHRQQTDAEALGEPGALVTNCRRHLIDVPVDPVQQLAHRSGLQGGQVLPESHAAEPATHVGGPVGGQAGHQQTHSEVAEDHGDQGCGQYGEEASRTMHQHRAGQRRRARLPSGAQHDQDGHDRHTTGRSTPQITEQAHGKSSGTWVAETSACRHHPVNSTDFPAPELDFRQFRQRRQPTCSTPPATATSPVSRTRHGAQNRRFQVSAASSRQRAAQWRTRAGRQNSGGSTGIPGVSPDLMRSSQTRRRQRLLDRLGFLDVGVSGRPGCPDFREPEWITRARGDSTPWAQRCVGHLFGWWGFVGGDWAHPWAGIKAGSWSLHTLTIGVPPTRRPTPEGWSRRPECQPPPGRYSPHERPQAPPRRGCRRVGPPGMTSAPRSLQSPRTTTWYRPDQGAGAGRWANPGMTPARRSLHMDPAPRAPRS
ncbi:hypothetical protein ONO86_02316 [Micromonospora noduli]|nr:hypothetical protein ONO86_02316 [Micromonospora noduli]